MTYTHLTIEELVMIEAYFHQKVSVSKIATFISRLRQTIHNIVTSLRKGSTALGYFKQYKENKKCCGRRPIALPNDQQEYIQKMDTRCDYWLCRKTHCLFSTHLV